MRANQLIKGLSRHASGEVSKFLLQFMTTKKSEMGGLAPCQFFDFGALTDKALLEEFESAFEAYLEGFLRLPAPLCVFEHQNGDQELGLKADIISFYATPQGLDQFKDALPNAMKEFGQTHWLDDRSIIGTWLLRTNYPTTLNGNGHPILYIKGDEHWSFAGAFSQINFEDSKRLRARSGQFLQVTDDFNGDPESIADLVYGPLFVFLARLNARGMERQIIHAPERLNKSRIKKGVAPYVSYTKVSVNPYHQTLGHSGPRSDKEYTPKRYHFRRGHVRHFQNGQKTWVTPCFVGTPELGSVEHTYQVSNETRFSAQV